MFERMSGRQIWFFLLLGRSNILWYGFTSFPDFYFANTKEFQSYVGKIPPRRLFAFDSLRMEYGSDEIVLSDDFGSIESVSAYEYAFSGSSLNEKLASVVDGQRIYSPLLSLVGGEVYLLDFDFYESEVCDRMREEVDGRSFAKEFLFA